MKLINPKELLFRPGKFLDKKTVKTKELAKYIFAISLVPAIVFAIAAYTGITYIQGIPIMSLLSLGNFSFYTGAALSGLVFVFVIIGSLLSFFIGGAILHLFVKLLEGKKKYEDTLNAVATSMTPSLLLGWIPFVNVWTIIQAVVTMVLGISKKHKLNIFRSALVVAVPIIILSAIVPLLIMESGAAVPWIITQLIPITLAG